MKRNKQDYAAIPTMIYTFCIFIFTNKQNLHGCIEIHGRQYR